MKVKTIAKLAAPALCSILLVSAAACKGGGMIDDYDTKTHVALDENEVKYEAGTSETYFNYIELYDDHGDIYQIADPLIMRWNGKYYLYTSLTGGNVKRGIPCWKSDNMIDWEFANWIYGDSNAGDTLSDTAYAPEVVYYRGYFYLVYGATSGKAGHYLFRSDTPDGKYVQVVDQSLGQGIDGTLYVDSEDRLWLISAVTDSDKSDIAAVELVVDEATGKVTRKTDSAGKLVPETPLYPASLNGWTEGPNTFTRNGYDFLTYTGNHVDSSTYRLGYSYAKESIFTDLTSKTENVFLMNTGFDTPYEGGGYNSGKNGTTPANVTTYRGLGHGSNVYGPDMDSVFTAFHSAGRLDHLGVQGSSFNRRYNVTQMFTNGPELTVNGLSNYPTPKPAKPTFASDGSDLETAGGWQLSAEVSEAVYTAELNFTLTDGAGSVAVGYENGGFTEIAVNGTSLTVKKGSETLGTATIATSLNPNALHTVKVINGAAKSEVWYDGVRRLILNKPLSGAGKIGVKEGLTAGAVMFTNDAFGTGEFETPKSLTANFPAYSYLKGENRGFSIANAKIDGNGVRQGEKESTIQAGDERAVVLKKGDWVKYSVNAPEAGTYAMQVTVPAESMGTIFEVIVDEEKIYRMDIKDAVFENEEGKFGYLPVYAGAFDIETAGLHSVKVRVYKGNLTVTDIAFRAHAESFEPVSEDLLEGVPASGFTKVVGTFSRSSTYGIYTSKTEERSLLTFGSKGRADYELSFDLLVGEGEANILLRADQFCFDGHNSTPVNGYRGYAVVIGKKSVQLQKYSYSGSLLNLDPAYPMKDGKLLLSGSSPNRITVRIVQNVITVSVEGVEVLCYADPAPYLDGYCAFTTRKSEVFFRNLELKSL